MRTSRGRILSVMTALAVVATLPLAAQPPRDEDLPGATWAQGTVVNLTEDAISIEREGGGQMTFYIDEHTVGAREYDLGARVRIDYVEEDGRMLAREIIGPAPSETAEIPPAGESQVTDIETTPSTATAEVEGVEVQAQTETELQPEHETGMHAEAETDLGTEAQADFGEDETDALPATASELPLVALLGLLALAGAVAIRSVRR